MCARKHVAKLRDIHLIKAKLNSVEMRIEECRYILNIVEDAETIAHFTDVLIDLKELRAKYSDKLTELNGGRCNGRCCSCS